MKKLRVRCSQCRKLVEVHALVFPAQVALSAFIQEHDCGFCAKEAQAVVRMYCPKGHTVYENIATRSYVR